MTILITDTGYIHESGEAPKVGKRYRLTKLTKPRSTGARSLNSHTHGHYEDIAEQLTFGGTTTTADAVGRLIKIEAMKAGEWPTERDENGETIVNPISKQLEPLSEAASTTEESARLVNFIHWFADQHGWWLTEYIDGVPTRVYGGAPDSTIYKG